MKPLTKLELEQQTVMTSKAARNLNAIIEKVDELVDALNEMREAIDSSSGPGMDTKGGECRRCGEWKGGDYGMNGAGEQNRHTCPKEPTGPECGDCGLCYKCHMAATIEPTTGEEHDMAEGNDYLYCKKCGRACGDYSEMAATKCAPLQDWEARFDEKYLGEYGIGTWTLGWAENLKTFIREEREKAYEERKMSHVGPPCGMHAEDLKEAYQKGRKVVVGEVLSRVKGKHKNTRSAYSSDSWDSGYHDALFEVEKSIIDLLDRLT